jgi:hypothetical protein
MTVEAGDLNYLGMALAVLANIAIGFVWYSPNTPTGKAWIRSSGHRTDERPTAKAMATSMGLMVVGVVLTMYVLAHVVAAFHDAYRLDMASYRLTALDGLLTGFFVWLGFYLPVQLNGVAFDRRPWTFALVNAGYYLTVLLVAGVLMATVGA